MALLDFLLQPGGILSRLAAPAGMLSGNPLQPAAAPSYPGQWAPGGKAASLMPKPTIPQPWSAATPSGAAAASSPIADFFRNNPSTVAALAAGIGGAPSMRMGLAQAAGALPQAMGADTQLQQTRGQTQALSEFFGNPTNAPDLSPGQRQLFGRYPTLAQNYFTTKMASLNPSTDDIKEYNVAKSQGYDGSFVDYLTKIKGASQSQENAYGTPIFHYDPSNNVTGYDLFTNRGTVYHYDAGGNFLNESRVGAPNPASGQVSSAPNASGGAPQAAPTPSAGGTVRPPGSVKLGNQGTQLQILTPSGAQVGTLPVDNTGKAAQTAAGAASGAAAANLPTSLNSAQRLIDNIDRLSSDPALDSVIGRFMPIGVPKPAMPTMNDDMARARAEIDQVLGGTFLQAYNDLRGAGAITEREGAAAQSAYNKLRNTDMGAQDYRAALQEFKTEVQKLMGIARTRAQLGGVAQPAPSAPAAPAANDPLGIR